MLFRCNPRSALQASTSLRSFSDQIHFGPSDDQLQEILGRSLDKKAAGSDGAPHVLTTRREALGLYRDIWRYSRLFIWKDDSGQLWRDVIRTSARQEFEASRHQTDPQMVTQLLLTGRDCLHQSIEKFLKRRQDIIDKEMKRPPFEVG